MSSSSSEDDDESLTLATKLKIALGVAIPVFLLTIALLTLGAFILGRRGSLRRPRDPETGRKVGPLIPALPGREKKVVGEKVEEEEGDEEKGGEKVVEGSMQHELEGQGVVEMPTQVNWPEMEEQRGVVEMGVPVRAGVVAELEAREVVVGKERDGKDEK